MLISPSYQNTNQTLIDILSWIAENHPEKPAYVFLKDGKTENARCTYSELSYQAQAVGAGLRNRCKRGDRVLLLFPPGLDFIRALFGCFYAGVIAIPTPYPERHFPALYSRIQTITKDAQASLNLTTSALCNSENKRDLLSGDGPTLPCLALNDLMLSESNMDAGATIHAQDLAYLQYTSGSTSLPKGVKVSHDNVMSQCADLCLAGRCDTDSVLVNWMPHFHDFGLVQGLLVPLFAGIPAYIMSPLTFLKRPMNWLEAMSRLGGTHSGGPNFAYEHCVQKTTETERTTLDLQRWQVASCGSEPIQRETIQNFIHAFEPCGFKANALRPGYGLAEFTLMASGKPQIEPLRWEIVNRDALERHEVLSASENEMDSTRTLLGCGNVGAKTQIAVVDPNHLQKCGPHQIGEIWLAGPSVAQGYWNRPKETQDTFKAYLADTGEGPFLRTGDLGFLKDGELFITGRIKDLIISRGRNYYPHDIEQTIDANHQSLGKGKVAAVSSDREGEERLIVLKEVARSLEQSEIEKTAGLIRQTVIDHHDIQPYAVLFMKSGSLPLTTSGKIQRYACRLAYEAGDLPVLGSSVINLSSTSDFEQDTKIAYNTIQQSPAGHERQKALEDYLCQQLSQKLSQSPQHIKPTNTLSSLGLDSLMAIELRNHIEFNLRIDLPLSKIFEASCITDLAKTIEQRLTPTTDAHQKRLLTVSRDRSLPASFAQEGFWVLNRFNPGDPSHHICLQFTLTGSLNQKLLAEAFNHIIERHESLRTTFKSLDNQVVQVVAPSLTLPVSMIDLRQLPKIQRHKRVKEKIHEENLRPFDLEKGPLVRMSLIQTTSTEHVLLLSFHHIISDWHSIDLFLKELSGIYFSLLNGEQPRLSPLPIQYADYALWQRERLQGKESERLLDYWRKTLQGAPTTIDFPDRSIALREPAAHRTAGQFSLSHAQIKALKDLSHQEGTTVFMTLVAAFFVLLFRYTHQTDLVIGTPATNRIKQELDGLIGMFINPLVLRANMTGNPTFREFLQQVKHVTLKAYDHQAYPFELLVKELKPIRDKNQNPLFQVLFDFQSSNGLDLDLSGVDSKLQAYDPPNTQFDLTISLLEEPDSLEGRVDYNTELFDSGFVEHMAESFPILVNSALAQPDQSIANLTIMSNSEEDQLLNLWSGAADLDFHKSDSCIHELFESQVIQTPDAIAVVYQDEQLTYRELNDRATRLAHHLRSLGVYPDTLVGLCMPKGPDLVISILGILKASGAYVPLDPNYPNDRLRFILKDTQISIVLSQSSIPQEKFSSVNHVVLIDQDQGKIARYPKTNLPKVTSSENFAYMLYTSGSTGMPKGVVGTHKGLVNAYPAWEQAYRLQTVRNHLQLANVVFDVFLEDLLRALCSGGKLVICPEDLATSPQLLDLMRREAIDVIEMVPATMRVIVQYLEERRQKLDQIKLLIIGADRWNIAELPRLRKLCSPETRIINSYGVTESTVDSTYFEDTEYELEGSRAVPIGRPMHNTLIYILDEQLRPVPPYVIGELYIGGSGVARGYWNRPELTKERFVSNPFHPRCGNSLYKTGDRARFLGDGTIEFLGRQDYQVKINGLRIELGEIEHALSQHTEVKENVAVVGKDHLEHKVLTVYVVAKDSAHPPTSQNLREFLVEQLPRPMIPTTFVFLASLPSTPSGKINRQALPQPEAVAPLNQVEYQAPRTELERQLVQIWEDVLQKSPIGIREDFFDIGGYSLLAVSIFQQIEKLTGQTLPLSILFQASTIEKLAEAIGNNVKQPSLQALVPIQTTGTHPPLFIVHAIGGNVLTFAPLPKLLGKDQPIYGLQSIGLDGQERPINKIEEMAARYIQEVQIIQPRGPYFLAGACMGGVVAYEMAQQFHAHGQTVAFLGLVESWLPDLFDEPETWDFAMGPRVNYLVRGLQAQKEILKNLSGKDWLAFGRKKLKVIAQMASNMDVYKRKTDQQRDFVSHANQQALSTYVPKPYSGRISYFLAAKRSIPIKKDPRLKWNNYARGGFKLYRVPAINTGQMFKSPCVEILGKQIKQELHHARRNTSTKA